MFNLQNQRIADGLSLGIMALIAAVAGLLAAADPATDAAVGGGIDATVSAISSAECASTVDCVSGTPSSSEPGVASSNDRR